jgi:hypothetical protein
MVRKKTNTFSSVRKIAPLSKKSVSDRSVLDRSIHNLTSPSSALNSTAGESDSMGQPEHWDLVEAGTATMRWRRERTDHRGRGEPTVVGFKVEEALVWPPEEAPKQPPWHLDPDCRWRSPPHAALRCPHRGGLDHPRSLYFPPALIRPLRIPCFTSAPNAQHARLWLARADELIKLKPLSHLTIVKRL